VSDSAPKRRLTLAGLAGAREGGAPVRERLTSMLFLAALAHAIVILGLSFGVASHPGSAAPGMESLSAGVAQAASSITADHIHWYFDFVTDHNSS